jgi:CheY-specific phosphatase CheX
MQSTNPPVVLKRTVQQVLETMCFSEVLPTAESQIETSEIATDVKFRGSYVGRLRLEMGKNTAELLATSFLGFRSLQPDSSAPRETVHELGNIICGRFLSELDPSAELNIDPPMETKPLGDSAEVLWHNFQADCGAFRVAVYLDSTK